MKLFIKILVCCAPLMSVSAVSGQHNGFQHMKKISVSFVSITKSYGKNFVTPSPVATSMTPVYPFLSNSKIPEDTYTRNFGFFCREELQLQKRTGVNFSLRLGTLDYCNYMEGKSRVIGPSY